MKLKTVHSLLTEQRQLAYIGEHINKEMDTPVFNNVNPHFKNKFADLSAITNACKTALLNNDLSPMQRYGFVDNIWGVLTSIVYKDGTAISDSFYPINNSLIRKKMLMLKRCAIIIRLTHWHNFHLTATRVRMMLSMQRKINDADT